MKGNKHREFLKRIRLPEEERSEKSGGYQGTQRNPAHKMTGQAQIQMPDHPGGIFCHCAVCDVSHGAAAGRRFCDRFCNCLQGDGRAHETLLFR